MYSTAYELTLFYLRAIGFDEDEPEYKISDVVRSCDVETRIDAIADIINKRIREQDRECLTSNWQTRRIAYNSICNHFCQYVYCRFWNFSTQLPAVPENLSDFFKGLFTTKDQNPAEYAQDFNSTSWNISDVFRTSSNPEIARLISIQSNKDLETLDIQARQYIFVYSYEHGINIGYH